MQTGITQARLGQLPDGATIAACTPLNANGLVAKIADAGGTVTALHVPGRRKRCADAVSGVAPRLRAPILRPGAGYRSVSRYCFSVEEQA